MKNNARYQKQNALKKQLYLAVILIFCELNTLPNLGTEINNQ
jgi:hypothetical protein